MSDKAILIIAPHYKYFIKDQIEEISKQIGRIDVVVPFPWLIENFKVISALRRRTRSELIDKSTMPDNVRIHDIDYIYWPDKKVKAKNMVNAVSEEIKKKKIEFDLIHSHFIYPFGYVGAMLKEKYRVPLIITAHGYDVYSFPFSNKQARSMTKEALDKSDMIITVSKRNHDIITQELNVSVDKVSIIPNGANQKLFSPLDKANCRRKLRIGRTDKIILSIGNLKKIKGHVYLIDAVKKLKDDGYHIRVFIIGDGPEKNSLQKRIQDHGLEEEISLIGAKHHHELSIWINACDVFALPSVDEGNPTVLVEALACGIPVIASAVGGIPEVINLNNGVLFEPKNVNQIAEALIIGLTKQWDQKKITDSSEKYRWDVLIKGIIDIYRLLDKDTKS